MSFFPSSWRSFVSESRTIAMSGAPRCLNEHVDSLLATNGQSPGKYLHRDEAPSDETDFLAFDALVAEQETRLLIWSLTRHPTPVVCLLSSVDWMKE